MQASFSYLFLGLFLGGRARGSDELVDGGREDGIGYANQKLQC